MSRKEQTSAFNMWWWAAAGFIVIVLIAALGMVFFTKSGNNNTESQQQSPTEATSDPPAETKDGQCEGLSSDQSYPTTAPETKWEAYDNSALTVPISKEFGPLEHGGKMPKCFAHSPAGAVYAAPNLMAAFTPGFQKEAAVDSPEVEKLLQEQKEAEGGNPGTIRGFRVDSYTDSEAEISLYIEQGDVHASLTTSLLWDEQENDWRLDLRDGNPAFEQTTADDFVMWR